MGDGNRSAPRSNAARSSWWREREAESLQRILELRLQLLGGGEYCRRVRSPGRLALRFDRHPKDGGMVAAIRTMHADRRCEEGGCAGIGQRDSLSRGTPAMKINVEVDCTPEEARHAMGLPDLTPLHDRYVAMMMDTIERGGLRPEMLESMVKSWMPMSEAGLSMWRTLIDGATSKPNG